MKRLFLLRHAKSSWDDPDLADHDRPLAPRGRRAAKAIGEHMRREGIEPELVLCSSSRRTRETLERLRLDSETLIEDELYAASAQRLLERLRAVDEGVGSVLLIGHNPGVEDLAETLGGEAQAKYPTGALATLELDGTWRGLRAGGARLAGFVTPKQLG
jgi:phosphohistidine phosphatase